MTLQIQIPQISPAAFFLNAVRSLNPSLSETQIVEAVLTTAAKEALVDVSLIESYAVDTAAVVQGMNPRKNRRASR